jgi:hypothetical protein
VIAWNPLLAHRALGWLGPDVRAPARLVASRLVSHADREGRSHPSIARLAYETGLSDRTVQRALSQLRAAGVVTWLSAFEPTTGRHGSNRYRVSLAALLERESAERRRRSAGWCPPDTGGGVDASGGGVGVADDQLRDLPTTKEEEARGRTDAHVPPTPAPANDAAAADVGSLESDDLPAPAAPDAPPAPRVEPEDQPTPPEPARPEGDGANRVSAPSAEAPTDPPSAPVGVAGAASSTPPPGGIALEAARTAWRAAHSARYGRATPPAGPNDEALLLELLERAGAELTRTGLGRGDPGAAARVVGRVLRFYVREDGSRETYREGFLVQKRHTLGFLRGERKLGDFFAAALGAEAREAQATYRARARAEFGKEARQAPPPGDFWREAIERLHSAAAGPPVPRPRLASGAR